MYCEKCGSELQEGAQFCTSCGEMVTCPPKSETTPDDPTVETFDEAEKPLNNDQELAKVKKTHTIRKKKPSYLLLQFRQSLQRESSRY